MFRGSIPLTPQFLSFGIAHAPVPQIMSKDTKLVIYILQLKISCIHLGLTKNHSKSFKS